VSSRTADGDDDAVRGAVGHGEVPLLGGVRDGDHPRPGGPRRLDHQDADPADAVDHGGGAQPQPGQLGGVHRRHARAGQHGGGREIHRVGNRHQVALGHGHVLGVAAVGVEAKLAGLAVADVGPAGQALLARTAEDLVVDGHPVTGGQRGALARRLDDPRRLVADGHGVRVGLDHAVQDVQVRPAHPRGLDPHQDLTRARCWIR
jgi:hypothetical protein